jgi:hypothetical protein
MSVGTSNIAVFPGSATRRFSCSFSGRLLLGPSWDFIKREDLQCLALLLQCQSSSWELCSFTFASMLLFGSKANRLGTLVLALLASGAIAGGLIGLLIALPPSTVECGDECGVRALVFALRCAVVSGVLIACAGGIVVKVRSRNRAC